MLTFFQAANKHSTSIQTTTKSVHAETVRVVDEQVKDLGIQMEALDDFVTRARCENAAHHSKHTESMQGLSTTVEQSYGSISGQFKKTFDRVKVLGADMDAETGELHDGLEPLRDTVSRPLQVLRDTVERTVLREYEPTGATPEKKQYQYPTGLPRTEAHEVLLAGLQDGSTPTKPAPSSQAGPVVFADLDHPDLLRSPPLPLTGSIFGSGPALPSEKAQHPFSMSLREVNPNLTANLTTNFTGSLMFDPSVSIMSAAPAAGAGDHTLPMPKRSSRVQRAGTGKKHAGAGGLALDGRENVPPTAFSQSFGRRKSPRLH